jgi:hypothetical protein
VALFILQAFKEQLLSVKIKVPDNIASKAAERLMSISFDEAISYMIKGPSRHLTIEPNCGFEMFLSNVKPIGYRICEFTFAISHECPDDRTNWVVDQKITVILICDEASVFMKGI